MGKPEISVRKSDDMPFCLGNFSKYGLRFEVMPFFCSFESHLLMWIYFRKVLRLEDRFALLPSYSP